MIRIFFGHHKCASTYIKDVFIQSTDILGIVPRQVYGLSFNLPLDYSHQFDYMKALEKRTSILNKGDYKTLILTNTDIETLSIIEKISDYKGFHVIRDPRDIVVSAYFSHLYSHEAVEGTWWLEFRNRLQKVKTQEEGLLLELDFLQSFFQNMYTWNYENSNIYESKYEILTRDPLSEFRRIYNFLGIKTPKIGLLTLVSLYFDQKNSARHGKPMPYREILPVFMLKRILDRNSFLRHTKGRNKGQEDTQSHYRKGVSGDWCKYFSPVIKDEFKKRYPDLLKKLNYEDNEDW